MTFIKNKEDFKCEKCGFFVAGNGYTNHCPECLWSKHVDIEPGDRLAVCQGLMEPIGIETDGGDTYIVQKCVKCGHTRRNRVAKGDNYDRIIAVSSRK